MKSGKNAHVLTLDAQGVRGAQITQSDLWTEPFDSTEVNNIMVTNPINTSGQQSQQLKSSKFALKSEDFIKMMVTQLQNQDPTNPAKNEELLAQMSQIGQLESSTNLNNSLKSMVLQNQIGASGNLIGKNIEGMDSNLETVKGVVNSVKVESGEVFLELDNGKRLPLGNVTQIAMAPATSRGVTAPLAASVGPVVN